MDTQSQEKIARINEVAEQIKNNTYHVPGARWQKRFWVFDEP